MALVSNESIFKKDFKFRNDLIFIFLLTAVAPFCVFAHFLPLGDFWENFIACASVSASLIIVLLVVSLKEKGFFNSGFVGWLSVFFAVLIAISFLQSVPMTDRYILLIYSAVVVMTASLALQLSYKNQLQYYHYLAFFLFLGGVIEALGAIAIQYRLMGIDYWMVPMNSRMYGFIAQSNQFAIYICVAFFALTYLTMEKVLPIVVLLLFSLLFGFVLLGSGSRAVLIYLVIATLGCIFCFIKMKERRLIMPIVGMVAVVLGAVLYQNIETVIHLVYPSIQLDVADTSTILARSSSSDSFRISEFFKAFALLKESHWMGVGFGQYGVKSFWLAVNNPDYIMLGDLTLHSHNLFAQVMAEFGIVGLVVLCAVLGYVAVCFWNAPKNALWWFAFSVVSVFFVNSMLEYVMWKVHFVIVLFLILTPMLKTGYKQKFPRVLSLAIVIVMAGAWGMLVQSSLTAYAQSFFYNESAKVADPESYAKYKDATQDVLWGRYIRLQEFTNPKVDVQELAYLQNITDETLLWQPYQAVIVKKLQLQAFSDKVMGVEKLSMALKRAYPLAVPSVCSYFSDNDAFAGRESVRIIKKTLGCRQVLATQHNDNK